MPQCDKREVTETIQEHFENNRKQQEEDRMRAELSGGTISMGPKLSKSGMVPVTAKQLIEGLVTGEIEKASEDDDVLSPYLYSVADKTVNKKSCGTQFTFAGYEINIARYAITALAKSSNMVGDPVSSLVDSASTIGIETNVKERTVVYDNILATFEQGMVCGIFFPNSGMYRVEIVSNTKSGLTSLVKLFGYELERSNFYQGRCLRIGERGINFIDVPAVKLADVVLPENIRTGFLTNTVHFLTCPKMHKITRKRGIILYGPPGCHGKGTKVVMYDGSLKNVEDVAVGDVLIGPDSMPRRVLELCRGRDEMCRVFPRKGDSFVVNFHHILSLKPSYIGGVLPSIVNTTVEEYTHLGGPTRERLKLWKTGVTFPQGDATLLLDPYFLGVWLGDGTEGKPEITTADSEIVKMLEDQALTLGMRLSYYNQYSNGKINKSKRYNIVNYHPTRAKKNIILECLKNLGVLNNKHIPEVYLMASEEQRLELLAGIIDTDGAYSDVRWRKAAKRKNTGWKGIYDIIQKSPVLSEQICRLAASLGFSVSKRMCQKTIKSIGFSGEYVRMHISGSIDRIPVRIARKKAQKGTPNKDPLRVGIQKIEQLGIGDYYGFILSGDHLYLTSDFMVHHNTGKTSLVSATFNKLNEEKITCLYVTGDSFRKIGFDETFRFVLKYLAPCMVVLEDFDLLAFDRGMGNRGMIGDILSWLNGIEDMSKPIVVIGTTNRFDVLDHAATRPCRFDRHYKIDFPSEKEVISLWEKMVGTNVNGIKKYVGKVTGAHIREIANTAKMMSAANGKSVADCAEEALEEVIESFLLVMPKGVGFQPERNTDPGYPTDPPTLSEPTSVGDLIHQKTGL